MSYHDKQSRHDCTVCGGCITTEHLLVTTFSSVKLQMCVTVRRCENFVRYVLGTCQNMEEKGQDKKVFSCASNILPLHARYFIFEMARKSTCI